MASLTGNSVGSSYQGLLKTTDNAAIGATSKVLTDGAGNATNISIATGSTSFNSGEVDFTGATVAGINGLAPAGGTTGQVLEKIDGTDYNYQWATPSGGGGSTPFGFTSAMSNQEYGPQWNYYNPTGSTLAGYGRRIIGFSHFIPAGTYDQLHHWVRTAATTAGTTSNYALYNVDTTTMPDNAALSFKPTTLVAGSVVTGVDATTTGEKLVNFASPITLTAGYYFFAFMVDNGVDNTFEGSYAGFPGNDGAKQAIIPAMIGAPTPYQFAATGPGSDALINQTAYYTSFPADLTSDNTYNNTSFRPAFTIVAQ